MKLRKIIALFSIITGFVFVLVVALLRPLWFDIYVFLDKVFPIMPAALGLGLVVLGAAVWAITRDKGWALSGILLFFDVVWVVLMAVLFSELGSENLVLYRNAARVLPVFLLALAAAAMIFWGPEWAWFRKSAIRGSMVLLLAAAAVLSFFHPWRVRLTSKPVWFYQQDGYAVVWATNMPATAQVWVGEAPGEGMGFSAQENGLLTVNEIIQSVFVPDDTLAGFPAEAAFSVESTGVRQVFPTSASKGGAAAASAEIQLPKADALPLTLMAFCDIHEEVDRYDRMQSQLDWDGVDLAVFMGDLLNHVDTPRQIAEGVLSLSTGDLDIPRVWVRGNHETRGALARGLDSEFLPEGGQWYFTFSIGDTFFIVLDSGEDKPDGHEEYAGLVDFSAFHQNQALWLADVLASDAYRNAGQRIVLVHIPPHQYSVESFSPVHELLTAQTEIDLLIAGHIHQGGFWPPSETSLPFPIATCGGSTEANMAALEVTVDQALITVRIFDGNGSLLREEAIDTESP